MQETNITVIRNNGGEQAVVFLHGFTGTRDDTWDRFPSLVGSGTADWDIFTIGYATTLLPDVVGIWSADPDLPILADMLRAQLGMPPFNGYRSLALIAHSMGGLVVQKALIDDGTIAERLKHVILFGTPSGGLRKAGWAQFWKRQLRNMAEGSSFIRDLRQGWQSLYGATPPFNFLVVAGASDQFVPPTSSLGPFDRTLQRVVIGDHLSVVKPATADAPSVSLVLSTLGAGVTPKPDPVAQLRLASERPTNEVPQLVKRVEASVDEMSVKMIVDAALALDRGGMRTESISLLQQHKDRDTDIKGTLAGRFKRIWLESDDRDYGARAAALYQEGLNAARAAHDSDQIYYHGINVAFMKFAFDHDEAGAREAANVALTYASPPGLDVWKTATVAEANLYLGKQTEALIEYRRLVTFEAEPWKAQSASLQAARIAATLGDRPLAEALESIFTPGARRANRIFVSYSHKDGDWLDRLRNMLAPYLHSAETELDLWDDKRIRAGEQWDTEIREALARAGVAVALVSADFLASSYVMNYELPVIVQAAREGDLRLLWAYVSAAGWEETALKAFQATHDTKIPLDARPRPEQNEVLKSIARQMKEAALGATNRFRYLPN